MKIYKKLLTSFFIATFLLSFAGIAHAMTPTLYLSTTTGDNVNVLVVGDTNSNIVLYYTTNYGLQNRTIGTTSNVGIFSLVISTSSYGITQGSSVYVMVNNQQSISSTWPYTTSSSVNNSLSLNQTNISLTVGQTSTITAYNSYNYGSLVVSSNSNSGVATAYASGNNISVNGISNGSTTLVICQSNNTNYCGTAYVTVGGGYSNPNSPYMLAPYPSTNNSGFNVSALNLSVGNSATITSTASNGLYVSENTNPKVVSVSYNASYVPGCTATSNYSITTGQPCNGGGSNYGGYYSSIPGCTASTNFSYLTGQSCGSGAINGQYSNSNNNTSATISALARGSTSLTLCQNSSNNICTTIYITTQ